MSANRKLQAEVDSVLKKVKEGILFFDDIWEKVYAATQQSLKEKYEGDLKKEIKKLQRLRDQIKTWLGSNEIKDKSQLLECRKQIEQKMEQFKICEKEMKTKAYSREGLARETKLDPKEAEKEAKGEWLGTCLDRLGELIDSLEADLEKIAGNSKKGKNKETMEKLENRIKKNKWHVARLEQIRRLMDNDCLDPSTIDDVKDDVDYYIESATDDDGAVGVSEEFDIYEVLELDAIPTSMPGKSDDEGEDGDAEAAAGTGTGAGSGPAPVDKEKAAPAPPSAGADAKLNEGETDTDSKAAKSVPAKKTVAGLPVVAAVSPAVVKGVTTPAVRVAAPVAVPAAKTTAKPVVPVTPAKPITAASTASPVAAAVTTAKIAASTAPATQQAAAAAIHARVEKKAANSAASVLGAAPVLSAASAAASAKAVPPPAAASAPAATAATTNVVPETEQKDKKSDGKEPAPGSSTTWAHAATQRAAAAAPPPAATPAVASSPSLKPISASTPVPAPAAAPTPAATVPPQTTPGAVPAASTPAPVVPQPRAQQPPAAQPAARNPLASPTLAPATAAKATAVLEKSPPPVSPPPPTEELSPTRLASLSPAPTPGAPAVPRLPTVPTTVPLNVQPNAAVNAEAAGVAQLNALNMLKQSLAYAPLSDSDRQQQGYMPRNPYPAHPSFPAAPISILENPALFERLPMDTLFFAFYYQQGSYQQFLAARQLKKHSWRFHKKYMTWFQRHEEPKVTSDEYEEGTYVYFDYESGWCQRIKSEFKFEYVFLEDESSTAPQNEAVRVT